MIFIHDEILAEVPIEKATEASTALSNIMVDTMTELCTPHINIKAEPALMKRWYKGAEAVWKDGKLLPWEPEEAK